jgi:class 3 adenylate cyclase/tetratricopeptide (TPR) repeat protein
MVVCPNCGKDNTQDSHFCSGCGSPLEVGGQTDARERRKMVTVVFCDLAGSTSMGERLDAESLRKIMARYYAAMRSVLERHGGTVEKFIGDAVVAVFGVPAVHEDDALRAVRAAAEMEAALVELNEELRQRWGTELRTRTGVNTGEVVAGDPSRGESFVVGDTVNVAARLEQSAPAGGILLGEETYGLVRNAVKVEGVDPLELKGKSDAVPAFRLLAVTPRAPGVARRLDSPLVGRARELAQLEEAFERALREENCELVTVLGPAGAGKSRLAHELAARVKGRASILQGRCLPYGEGITFWPLSEVVRQAAGIGAAESTEQANAKIASLLPVDPVGKGIAEHIASAVGLSAAASTPEETFYATRKLFERLAHDLPLVVVFDDLHWAEPTFLDLLEYLNGYSRDAPVLLLLMARPELRDARPALAGPDGPPTVILEPLGEEDSELLIENLLGEARLADDVSERITHTAQGNPLFVEELLRMLVDDGLLEKRNGSWSAAGDLSDIAMPSTIHALLGARLDRLSSKERGVIEPAAVVGQEFWRGAVVELAPKSLSQEIDVHLTALTAKELIQPGGAMFGGEEAYSFAHILIRDAAYTGLLKEARAELHEGVASWLERSAGERITEYEEILGYHLEQAFRYREQLAPLDAQGSALGRRAAERLGAAAGRALARGDMPAAANLFERAASLLPPGEPARRDLQLQLGLALCELGDISRAEAVLAETAAAAAAAGDRRSELRALLERSRWRLTTTSDESTHTLRRIAEQAIPVFERADDDAGLARAWAHLALLDSFGCRWATATESLERGLLHARRAAGAHLESELLWSLTGALQYGPTPVEEGIRRLHQILDRDAEAPRGAATQPLSLSTRAVVEATGLAGLEAMRGNFAEARMLTERAKAILEELGQAFRLADLGQVSGWIELLAEAPAAAEDELRRSYEVFEEMGERGCLSTTAGFLSEAIYAQGRYQEAERLSHVTERCAARDDLVSHVLWRGTRAKLLARRGNLEPAESLAREAVRLVAETDDLNLHADKLMDLAEVMRLAERSGEAAPFVSRALELYEAKGNVVSLQKASVLLVRIER